MRCAERDGPVCKFCMSLAVIGLAHKQKYVAEKQNVQQDTLCQPGHDPYEKRASHAGFTPSWCYICKKAQSRRQTTNQTLLMPQDLLCVLV